MFHLSFILQGNVCSIKKSPRLLLSPETQILSPLRPPSKSAVISYIVKTQLPLLCWKQSAISATQCYSHALLQCQKLKPILGWESACRGKRRSLQHTVPPCQSNWGQAGSTQALGSLGLCIPLEIENKMWQPLVSCH